MGNTFIWWGGEEALSLRHIAEFSVQGGMYDSDQRGVWELRAYRADQPDTEWYTLAAFPEEAEAMHALEQLMEGLHREGHAETFIIEFGSPIQTVVAPEGEA